MPENTAMRLFLFVLLLAPRPAFAWGPEGHQIVAHIAARALTPKARAAVGALLGGDAEAMMVLDSTWADEIRTDRPETQDWHFVNIELGSAGYDARRDCPQSDCVVAQIEKDEGILRDPKARDRAEALKFLIHFVADIHQPLHASDDHDKGGNLRPVAMGNERTTLHRIWDSDVVAALGDDPARVAAAIAQMPPAQKAAWSAGTPEGWADESFRVAERQIYAQLPKAPPGVEIALPADYPARERAVTSEQLAKAGFRLAATLNAIFR